MTIRQRIALGVGLLSLSLILIGVALIYPPAAFIVAGVLLGGLLFIDLPDLTKRTRA